MGSVSRQDLNTPVEKQTYLSHEWSPVSLERFLAPATSRCRNPTEPDLEDFTIQSEQSRSGAGGGEQGLKSSRELVNGEVKVEAETMPGVLVMDQDGADRSKKLRDGSNEEGKPLTNGVKVTAQLDGTAEMPTGDTAPWTTVTNGAAAEVAGQVVIPESLVDSWNQMPPELQHFEESYLPLSTLIERIAQQCYNGLEDTIEKMAEKPRDEAPHSGSPMVNGAGHHSATNGGMPLSKEDLRKRTLLMTFARDQRDRLIKLMVLTQWSRQVGDVSKLIDIWNWLLSQMQTHDEAANWIGQIKLNMIPMKQSNPDIKTALEVLTTGKAAWMPDVSCIGASSKALTDVFHS